MHSVRARPPIAALGGRHRGAVGNSLRPAVFGVNNGLVFNLNLVIAVAGASVSGGTVLLTGIAGLVAGACGHRRVHGNPPPLAQKNLARAPLQQPASADALSLSKMKQPSN